MNEETQTSHHLQWAELMMQVLAATEVMEDHWLESRETRELGSIGRRRSEGRVRSLFDMSAGRTWLRKGTGSKEDSWDLSSYRNLTLMPYMTLTQASFPLKLRLSLFSKSLRPIEAAKAQSNANQTVQRTIWQKLGNRLIRWTFSPMDSTITWAPWKMIISHPRL